MVALYDFIYVRASGRCIQLMGILFGQPHRILSALASLSVSTSHCEGRDDEFAQEMQSPRFRRYRTGSRSDRVRPGQTRSNRRLCASATRLATTVPMSSSQSKTRVFPAGRVSRCHLQHPRHPCNSLATPISHRPPQRVPSLEKVQVPVNHRPKSPTY